MVNGTEPPLSFSPGQVTDIPAKGRKKISTSERGMETRLPSSPLQLVWSLLSLGGILNALGRLAYT